MYNEFIKLNDLLSKIEALTVSQTINCISQNELKIISKLSKTPIAMSELATMLGITTGSATIAVNKLVKKNFLIRKNNKDDRRSVLVYLSNKGIKTKEFYENFTNNMNEILKKDISSKDLDLFNNVFRKILENILIYDKSLAKKPLTEFNENDLVEVSQIVGSKYLQSYLISLGINKGSIINILSINDTHIFLEIFTKRVKVSFSEASNIIVIRKYKE